MIETAFQTKIIEAFKEQAGDGYKSNNRYVVGVPDVHVVSPFTGQWLIEAKMAPLTANDPIIGTTANQVAFMNRWIRAGGKAMVMVAVHQDYHHWVWATTQIELKRIPCLQVFGDHKPGLLGSNQVSRGRGWSAAIMRAFHDALARPPSPC